MNIQILQNVKCYENQLQNIKINKDKIYNFVESINSNDLIINKRKLSHYDWVLEDMHKIVLYLNAMNFCFWAEKNHPKWTIQVDSKNMDGSVALFRAIEEEAKNNPSFLNPSVTKDMNFNEFSRILKGNVDIPLIQERYNNFINVSKVLSEKYHSSVEHLINKGKYDAVIILENLIKDFTSFDDTQIYKTKNLHFYKRAQLEVKMIDDQLKFYTKSGLSNMDKLVAFADYKIPQLLRHIGIFEYNDILANKVDSQTLIEKDSVEEVEIRIATILAIEAIYQDLKLKYENIVSSDIDTLLWLRSQSNSTNIKPYHRTYTIAY